MHGQKQKFSKILNIRNKKRITYKSNNFKIKLLIAHSKFRKKIIIDFQIQDLKQGYTYHKI